MINGITATASRSTEPRSTARSGVYGQEGGDGEAAEKGERCGLSHHSARCRNDLEGQSVIDVVTVLRRRGEGKRETAARQRRHRLGERTSAFSVWEVQAAGDPMSALRSR